MRMWESWSWNFSSAGLLGDFTKCIMQHFPSWPQKAAFLQTQFGNVSGDQACKARANRAPCSFNNISPTAQPGHSSQVASPPGHWVLGPRSVSICPSLQAAILDTTCLRFIAKGKCGIKRWMEDEWEFYTCSWRAGKFGGDFEFP